MIPSYLGNVIPPVRPEALVERDLDVRWVLLGDRLVNVELSLRCLDSGALDPLASWIVERVYGSDGLSYKQLIEQLPTTGVEARRVVAEVVHVLIKARLIDCNTSASDPQLTPIPERERPLTSYTLFNERARYVPAPDTISPRLPGIDKQTWDNLSRSEQVLCFEPAGEELYAREVLARRVRAAAMRDWRQLIDVTEVTHDRLEVLERSHLMPKGLALQGIDVNEAIVVNRRVLHFLFLHRHASASTEIALFVQRFPAGLRSPRYESYLRAHHAEKMRELFEAAPLCHATGPGHD